MLLNEIHRPVPLDISMLDKLLNAGVKVLYIRVIRRPVTTYHDTPGGKTRVTTKQTWVTSGIGPSSAVIKSLTVGDTNIKLMIEEDGMERVALIEDEDLEFCKLKKIDGQWCFIMNNWFSEPTYQEWLRTLKDKDWY